MAKYNFKIVIVGDSGTGKSSIIDSMKGGKFNKKRARTVDDFRHYRTLVNKDGPNYYVSIHDTVGQERLEHYEPRHREDTIKGADAVIICIDKINVDTINKWIDTVKKLFDKEIPILLVHNKMDIIAKAEDARSELLRQLKSVPISYHNIDYGLCSAKRREFYCKELTFVFSLFGRPNILYSDIEKGMFSNIISRINRVKTDF